MTTHGLRLKALAFNSDTDGWAVGDVLLHYDGIKWTSTEPDGRRNSFVFARDVVVDNRGDAWIVGDYGVMQHYHEGRWISIDTGIDDLVLTSIEIAPNSKALIGALIPHPKYGNTPLFMWDGQVFSQIPIACFSLEISCPYSPSPRTVDAGAHTDTAIKAISLHDDIGLAVGGTMHVRLSHDIDAYGAELIGFRDAYKVNDIDIIDKSDGWAVGSCGLILKRTNGAWNQVVSPVGCVDLLQVITPAPNAGWILSNSGHLLELNDGMWRASINLEMFAYDMLSASNENELWVLGRRPGGYGTILRVVGRQWSTVYEQTNENAYLLSMSYDDIRAQLWIVGTNGFLMKIASGESMVVEIPTKDDLVVVDALSDGNLLAASRHKIYATDGVDWWTIDLPTMDTSESIRSIDFITAEEGVVLVCEELPSKKGQLILFRKSHSPNILKKECFSQYVAIIIDRDDKNFAYIVDEYSTIARILTRYGITASNTIYLPTGLIRDLR